MARHQIAAFGSENQVCNQEKCELSSECSSVPNSFDVNVDRKNSVDEAKGGCQLQADPTLSLGLQRRFFFVDYSGGRSDICLHPSVFNDLSPGFQNKDISDLQALFEQTLSPEFLPVADLVFVNEERFDHSTEKRMTFQRLLTSAFAARDEMLSSRDRLSFLDGMRSDSHLFLTCNNGEAQCNSKIGWNINDLGSTDSSHSSLIDDLDDLDALLNSDDEATSDEASINLNLADIISVCPSQIYDVCAGCQSCHNREYERINMECIQRYVCDFKEDDKEVDVVSIAESSVSTYEGADLSSIISVPVSPSIASPQSPEALKFPSAFQLNDLSGGAPCLSTEVPSSNAVKRKNSTQESCVHSGSTKKPRSSVGAETSVDPMCQI